MERAMCPLEAPLTKLLRHLLAASLLALYLASPGALRAEAPSAATPVTFPAADGGEVGGLMRGTGDHGVVLAHGKVFDKESWEPLATRLAAAGLRVLALDFRGYGASRAGTAGPAALAQDILGAIRYLRQEGCARVSVVGASMGGGAAVEAAVLAEPGEIDRLALMAPAAGADPAAMKASAVLYVVSAEEPGAAAVREQFARAPEPKRLEELPGAAHAQHVFATAQGEPLGSLLEEFLTSSGSG